MKLKRTSKVLVCLIALTTLGPLSTLRGQVPAPNTAGIAMSQWYTLVRDVDAAKKFWLAMGGSPIKVDGVDVVKFPGVLVFLKKGEPTGGTVGTVIDHTGFHTRNGGELVAKLLVTGAKADPGAGKERDDPHFPSWGDVYSPDGVRVEVLDRARLFSERASDIAQTAPVATDHIHFFMPQAVLRDAQEWYAKTFGAKAFMDPIPNAAKPNIAALVPGAELKWEAATATVPTKGRALDHIGFEVKGLKAFCKKLEASGVKFAEPYSKSRHKGYASAQITDPWGTSIELTEGLNRF